MQNSKPKPTDLLGSPEAASLLKNKEALVGVLGSPDTKKLIDMLNQSAGGSLKGAADAAMKGDAGALMGLVQQIMTSQEGAGLVERISKSIPPE